MTLPFPPQPGIMQPPMGPPPIPPKPFSPFDVVGNETEPEVAGIRMRRLSRLMSTARFKAQPPPWRQLVTDEYNTARQAVASATQGAQPPGAQGSDATYKAMEQKIDALVNNALAANIAKLVSGQLGLNPAPPPGGPPHV